MVEPFAPIDLAALLALPGGTALRLRIVDRGEVYGDVAFGARLRDRVCVVLWGTGINVICGASQIEHAEIASHLPQATVVAIAAEQHRRFKPTGPFVKREQR